MDINPQEDRVLISDRFLVVDGVLMRERIERITNEDGLESEKIYRWIGEVRLEATCDPPGLYLDCILPDVVTLRAERSRSDEEGHVVVHITHGTLNGVRAVTVKKLVIPNQEDVTIESFELEWAQKWNPEMATLA